MVKVLVFFVAIAIDQATKIFAKSNLLGNGYGVITEKISCNPFIAWSIPLQGYWFWLIWFSVVFILIYLILEFPKNLSLIIVLAGAIANFIDRIRYGCVIDFIQIGSFPTFNLADAMITIGITIFALQLLQEEKRKL